MTRIAIDYTAAHKQGGGIGRYVRELVAALARQPAHFQYHLFAAGARQSDLHNLPGDNFTWHSTRITPRWFARIWHRLRLPLPVEVFTGAIELYHATDFVLPPTLPRTRTLLTVHDLSFVRVPESASPSLKAYLDTVVPRSARRADHILADSQATKDDLVELYHLPADKITVLLSGVDPRFRPADEAARRDIRLRLKLDARPYILAVGTVQPRKNYIRLIEAVAQVRCEGHDLQLVIAGGKGWLDDPIYRAVEKLSLSDSIRFTGFIADSDLPALYSEARCLAFPSLYEGFGLPILEAMACGTPVVTSNSSSMPEAAGDAALLIDPYDSSALAGALVRLHSDESLRERLITRGRSRATLFTWDRAASQLLDIYRHLLST